MTNTLSHAIAPSDTPDRAISVRSQLAGHAKLPHPGHGFQESEPDSVTGDIYYDLVLRVAAGDPDIVIAATMSDRLTVAGYVREAPVLEMPVEAWLYTAPGFLSGIAEAAALIFQLGRESAEVPA